MIAKRILVIDNEPYIQETIQICLETIADWQVITASSGLEGLSKAQSEQPDAILLDAIMPEMDGITTYQKLQENPLTQSIPVIFLTAKATEISARNQSLRLPTAALPKPFNPLELPDSIARLLGWNI
jgi:CheY-like chemotaxis protein